LSSAKLQQLDSNIERKYNSGLEKEWQRKQTMTATKSRRCKNEDKNKRTKTKKNKKPSSLTATTDTTVNKRLFTSS